MRADDYTFGEKTRAWERQLPGTPLGKRSVPKFSAEFGVFLEFDPPVNLHPRHRIQNEGSIELRQRAPGAFFLVIHWMYGGTPSGVGVIGLWAAGVADVDTAVAQRIAQFIWTPAITDAAGLSPNAIEQAREGTYSCLGLDNGAVLFQREKLLLAAGLDDASISRRRASALLVAKLQNPDVALLQHDALVAFDKTILATDDLASIMPPGAVDKE